MKSILEEYKETAILDFKTNVIKNALSMGYTDNKLLSLLVNLPINKILEIRKNLILNKE